MLKALAYFKNQEQCLLKKCTALFTAEKVESAKPPPSLQFHHLYFEHQILQTLGFQDKCKKLMKKIQVFIGQTYAAEAAQLTHQASTKSNQLEIVNWNVEKLNYMFLHKMQDEIQKASLQFYQDLLKYSKKVSQSKKISSIWEIRNMFERNILWQLKWSFKPNVHYEITNFHLNRYRKYVQICLNSIINEYPANYDVYEGIQNQQIRPKSLNKKIVQRLIQKKLDEAKIIQQKLGGDSEAEKIAIKMTETYASRFISLFKPSQNLYWENGLSQQQKRFSQTAKNVNGIVFVPTIYTAQILQRSFDEFKRQDPAFTVTKQYRYLMGLKYNGKSHSEILARLLASYLTNFKILSIPTFEKQNLSEVVSSLCSIISRDLWYHLTPQIINKLAKISSKNSQNSQNSQKTKKYTEQEATKFDSKFSSYRKDTKSIFDKIVDKRFFLEKDRNSHKSMFLQKINVKFQDNKRQLYLFYKIIQIINQIDPQVIVIDQFNFFGRNLYKINNQKVPSTQTIVQIATLMVLPNKLFALHRNVKMFASINDYPYLELFNIMNKNNTNTDLHQQSMINFLFEGKQRTKHLLTFLQIMLNGKNQNSQIKDFINSDIFVDLLGSTINVALNLRQCNKLAEFLYTQLQKNSLTLKKMLNDSQNIIQNIFKQPLFQIQALIMKFIQDQIIKFCQEAQMEELQTQNYFKILFSVYESEFRGIQQTFNKLLFLRRNNYNKESWKLISNQSKEQNDQNINAGPKLNNLRGYYCFVRSNPQYNSYGKRGHQGYKQIIKKLLESNGIDTIIDKVTKYGNATYQYLLGLFVRAIRRSIHNKDKSQSQDLKRSLENLIGIYLQRSIIKDLFSKSNIKLENMKISYEKCVSFQIDNKKKINKQLPKQKMAEEKTTEQKTFFKSKFQKVDLNINKIVYLLPDTNNQFIQKQNLDNFFAKNSELGTLYVLKTVKDNQGVDIYCTLNHNGQIYIFAIQIGKNTFDTNLRGVTQYLGYQSTAQNEANIKQLKKKYQFKHIVAELEPRDLITIKTKIQDYSLYKEKIKEKVKQQKLPQYYQNFGYAQISELFGGKQVLQSLSLFIQANTICKQAKNNKKADNIDEKEKNIQRKQSKETNQQENNKHR